MCILCVTLLKVCPSILHLWACICTVLGGAWCRVITPRLMLPSSPIGGDHAPLSPVLGSLKEWVTHYIEQCGPPLYVNSPDTTQLHACNYGANDTFDSVVMFFKHECFCVCMCVCVSDKANATGRNIGDKCVCPGLLPKICHTLNKLLQCHAAPKTMQEYFVVLQH